MKTLICLTFAALTLGAVETTPVVSKTMDRTVKLPGEFAPFEFADLHARVNGYVERVTVDRGSVVKKGQLLVELSAPELKAQRAEAESRVKVAGSQKAEVEARLAAARATAIRLKTASQTPGAIAGNELVQAEAVVAAAHASVAAAEGAMRAAEAAAQAVRDLEMYLKITAPFDGVVTDRFVHPGALAGPNTPALLRIEHNTRLRLIVAVPEAYAGAISRGARVSFTAPAFSGETFQGTVARVSHSMDAKTRTMPVELDVANPGGRLAPGMFPEVAWPVHRAKPALFVPASSVVTTTERTFVIRAVGGKAQWVNVKRGAASGDLVEVTGALNAGDAVVTRASDEIRDGADLK